MQKLSVDIRCLFNAKQANSFSFSIKQTLPLQGITGIFGHSGSGKSTLLRAIAGLDKTVSGEITFVSNQQETTLLKSEDKIYVPAEKRNISLIFQDSRLFPHLSVKENLIFAMKRRQVSKNQPKAPSEKSQQQQALSLDEIASLTLLTPLLERSVTQLSGGEQQRVALARALLAQPDLLLLDEPLSALDQHSKNMMLQLLKNIQQKLNIPMLYVSHSLDEIQQLADNLLVLSNGKVFTYGEIHQVIHQLSSGQLSATPLNTGALKKPPLIHQQTSLTLQRANNSECKNKNDVSEEEKYGLAAYQLLVDNTDGNDKDEALTRSQKLYLSSVMLTARNNKLPEELRCFILASDISLSVTEPVDSSIVNQLSGVICNIEENNHQVLVSIQCPNNSLISQNKNQLIAPANSQIFFASISAFSLHKLALKVDQTIYLQFKASAVRTFIN